MRKLRAPQIRPVESERSVAPGPAPARAKLVVNIPCLNEEATLPEVLESIPSRIPGVARIEVQVIDDGSSDRTAEVARAYGCRVVRHRTNRGLGAAFRRGLEEALAAGADLMVNTDADHQYPGEEIPRLVEPVLAGRCDVSIGNRRPWSLRHFSPFKRLFQYVGSAAVRQVTGTDVPDTVSGFRAYSREALLNLTVTTRFSYVLDTIAQGKRKGLKIESVPIRVNETKRPSRLFRSMAQHIFRSGLDVARLYAVYQPFRTFLGGALLLAAPGAALLARFFYFYFTGDGDGHIQSLVVSAILFTLSGLFFALAVIAELIGTNRDLLEQSLLLGRRRAHPPEGRGVRE